MLARRPAGSPAAAHESRNQNLANPSCTGIYRKDTGCGCICVSTPNPNRWEVHTDLPKPESFARWCECGGSTNITLSRALRPELHVTRRRLRLSLLVFPCGGSPKLSLPDLNWDADQMGGPVPDWTTAPPPPLRMLRNRPTLADMAGSAFLIRSHYKTPHHLPFGVQPQAEIRGCHATVDRTRGKVVSLQSPIRI